MPPYFPGQWHQLHGICPQQFVPSKLHCEAMIRSSMVCSSFLCWPQSFMLIYTHFHKLGSSPTVLAAALSRCADWFSSQGLPQAHDCTGSVCGAASASKQRDAEIQRDQILVSSDSKADYMAAHNCIPNNTQQEANSPSRVFEVVEGA